MQIYFEVNGGLESLDIKVLLGAGLVILVAYLVFYFFMSFAFYRMAKKNNVKHAWVAFLPFARYLTAGKVIGTGTLFGKKSNKVGLVAMFATIFNYGVFIAHFILVYFAIYKAMTSGYNVIVSLSGGVYIEQSLPVSVDLLEHTLTDFVRGTSTPYFVAVLTLQYAQFLRDFVQIIFMYIFWSNLFVKYKPGMSAVYTIIATLSPILLGPFIEIGGIFAFIFRNRDQFDLEDYINSIKNRAYTQNVNPGNPYGQNPYQNNPYGQNPYQGNANDDPFEEFSDNNGKNDDPFGR